MSYAGRNLREKFESRFIMSEATRKRPIESKRYFYAVIPESQHEKALQSLRALGGQVIEDSVDWREAFPSDMLANEAASTLKGLRYREELTQQALSEQTGIPRRHISEMENGKRPIGKENARKIARALKTDYRLFL